MAAWCVSVISAFNPKKGALENRKCWNSRASKKTAFCFVLKCACQGQRVKDMHLLSENKGVFIWFTARSVVYTEPFQRETAKRQACGLAMNKVKGNVTLQMPSLSRIHCFLHASFTKNYIFQSVCTSTLTSCLWLMVGMNSFWTQDTKYPTIPFPEARFTL